MWIEDELKKDAGKIERSIHAMSNDYNTKLKRPLRANMRENKQNTTGFFMNFFDSIRKSEYEIYKQFSNLNNGTANTEETANTDEINISNKLTHDINEIRNSANDLPHPRLLSDLQHEYDIRVGRHSSSDTNNEKNRYIPYKIYCYIREKSEYCIQFQAVIHGRNIRLYFITFPESHISVCGKMKHGGAASFSTTAGSNLCASEIAVYQLYAYKVFIWLSMISQMSNKECSEKLDIYFYMTPFKKFRPSHDSSHGDDGEQILSAIHVNTGLTRNCERHGEIVVYRTEEWFKVFIHESIHNFNIDFIDSELHEANARLRESFCIPHGDILLFEAYTETWARIINVMFDTYFHNDRGNFIRIVREKLTNNAFFHLYQLVKSLDVMDLKYSQITVLTPENMNVCRKQYAEETNVYAYYIFGGILSAFALPFICWCCDHNKGSVIRFKQTEKNLRDFTDFICDAARDPALLSMIEYMEALPSSSSSTIDPVLKKTMRMSLE